MSEKRPNKLGYVRPKRYKTIHTEDVDKDRHLSSENAPPTASPEEPLLKNITDASLDHPAASGNIFIENESVGREKQCAPSGPNELDLDNVSKQNVTDEVQQSNENKPMKLQWVEDFRTNHPHSFFEDLCDDEIWNTAKEEQDNLFEDEESDSIFPDEANATDFDTEKTEKEETIYAGHFLPLRISMLLIWMYAVTHSITSTEFEDLLLLINLHLMYAHPALSSVYKFKSFFSKIDSTPKKHYYCSFCLCNINENCKRCPNTYCNKEIKTKADRGYFIEINVESRLKDMFQRQEFCELIQQRFKRSKRKENNIEDIYDGSIYRSMSSDNGPLSGSYPYNLSFTLNTDGIPVFKSSKLSIWPMYLMINELPFKQRKKSENMILCGLWFGDQKPFMMSFSEPLHQSLKNLEAGIEIDVNGKTEICQAFLLCLSADLPAKSIVLNMNQFNGNHSCIKCCQSGINFRTVAGGNVHVFPYNVTDPTGPERTSISEDALKAHQTKKTVNGIKGPSFLLLHKSFDCIQGVTIDYMHCVCLGICRLLSKLWFLPTNSSRTFSLYSSIELIDARISKLKPPHTISRLPRTISEHFKFWKASELRSWLFYYSMPLLYDIMEPVFWYHYCSFVLGIFILCKGSINEEELLVSQNLLNYFVFTFDELYGHKYLTLNLHSLLHLPENVRQLGPVWSTSCFAFENANGDILKLFHGTQYIDMQIVNAINVLQSLPGLSDVVSQSSPARKLIDKLIKVEIPKSKFSCYFLGKGDTEKMLSPEIFGVICEMLKGPVHKLTFFKRAVIHSIMYHSSDYTRVTSRNSYTVQYIDAKRSVRFGLISWFASHVNHSGEKRDLCCIRELEETHLNLVMPDISLFPEGFTNFLKMKCNHIAPVSKRSTKSVVLPVESILTLCVFVEGDSNDFICKEPNNMEINL